MLNSKRKENSRGVVLFAFNTDVDYVTIADRASQLIQHNLKLPVTLITDDDAEPKFAYDQVIRINNDFGTFRIDIETQARSNWRNFSRYRAYELSPYNDTILLDSDYLVFDSSLLKLFSTVLDYRLMHHSYTDAGPCPESMGVTSLPFVWATVIAFRKTERASMLFDLVGRIQRNYEYYRALYNIRERNFRNDYAFAIANNILSGYTIDESQGIPWTMYTVEKTVEKLVLKDNFIQIHHADTATVTPYQNIHIMDKQYLLSNNFKQVVETVCEPT